MEIESDDEFGDLNNVALNGPTITINNEDTFTLTKDSDQEIGQGMFFRVADDANALRFYAFKQITTPGPVEVRGQVASGTAAFTWDASNFAGFYYDLNDNVSTESLKVSGISGNVTPENGLVYSSTIKNVDYASDDFNGTFPVLGFFAEQYVPIKSNDASKLAKLVLDSDDKYTLKTGEKLDLGSGYALEAKQVDVDGAKVWLEFTKDGTYVDDQIISTETGASIWTAEFDKILGEDDVPVLKVHVNQVFQGAVDSIAQIDGLWLIDYSNALEIESDDEFGDLNNVALNGPTITINNEDTFTLTRDSEQEIGQGMFFKVADTPVNELRYYPYVEKIVGESDRVLPVADFSTNITSGYAPLSVHFIDLSQNAASRSWDFNSDGITGSSEMSPTFTYTTPGTYSVNLTASNPNGDASKNVTITVLNEDGSSDDDGDDSHSSRGGGSIGSPELRDNIESKELSQTYVISGHYVKFDFPKNATPIVYIAFDAKKTPGKTTTTVEMLNKKSILVSELPSDGVYKSVNIWAGNNGFITPSSIENAVICFKVEKSWVQDKSINQSSITLNRYSNKKWDQLPTNLSEEDDKYLYFIAQTPGFSPFAITGRTTATGTEIQPANGSKIYSGTETTIRSESNTESIEKKKWKHSSKR